MWYNMESRYKGVGMDNIQLVAILNSICPRPCPHSLMGDHFWFYNPVDKKSYCHLCNANVSDKQVRENE